MTQRVRKAIFPVGGLGTRFLPATKAMPKEMLPIVDKPLIQYAVEEAQAAGIEEFIFVTGRGKAAIEDHFDHSYELEDSLLRRGKAKELSAVQNCIRTPGKITYTRQQEPLGLGHAVWCARHLIGDEPCAILLADDLIQSDRPCLKQMMDAHEQVGGNMVAVMEVEKHEVSRYGILDLGDTQGRLTEARAVVEKPRPEDAPSRLAIIGRYILDPRVFLHLERQKPGAGGEIQLTDALASMIGDCALRGYRFSGHRFDCGDKVGFIEATIAFALARPDIGAAARRALDKYVPAPAAPVPQRNRQPVSRRSSAADLTIGA
jgi:UTP--glucose-1-phosphate uridylyltransferase